VCFRLFQAPLLRTATFRLTIGSAAFMAAALLLQSALIFWQTTAYEIARTDLLLARETALVAAKPQPALDRQLRMRASDDLHLLIPAAGLFDSRLRVLGGNLPAWPEGLALDGHVHQITVHTTDQGLREVRALAQRLPSGDVLVLSRGLRELDELRRIVLRSLMLCAIPSILIAVLGGIWLSHRALLRVGIMHRAIDRIMEGDLHERLPTGRAGKGGDDLDRLAGSVNRMLGRLEHLLDEIKGVGDDIAHDLRTPLARVRTRLDRARNAPSDAGALRMSIERAIIDLDQCFAVITALLRISEIENGRRRAGFARVPLHQIAADIIDLYEPIAEARQIVLAALPSDDAHVHGDRDLLIELAANLVDNAIKFTPPGGRVEIGVDSSSGEAVLRIADTGIGIPPAEREAVLGRFYRSDKSRHIEGSGLGLSLVAAIARLHSAVMTIRDMRPGSEPPGCVFEVGFKLEVAQS
jgi:signal transduction histidine kinase